MRLITWRMLPFALVAALACSNVLGIETLPRGTDAGGDSPDTAPPPWSFSSATCEPCMRSQCADAASACEADRGCHELRGCLVACALADVACRAACENAAPDDAAASLHQTLDGCMRLSCTDDCYGAFGLATMGGGTCEDCAQKNCAPLVRACVRSNAESPDGAPVATGAVGDCERVVACTLASVDPSTASHCFGAHLAGLAPARDLSDCLHHAACDGCPIAAADFRCVGDFRWRAMTGSGFDYSLIYKDTNGAPLPGLNVSSCLLADCSTCAQVSPSLTGVDGVAHVRLASLTSVGFRGCFLSQDSMPSGDPTVPMLLVLGRPLVEPEGWVVDAQFPKSYLEGLATLTKQTFDDKAAQLGVLAIDCGNYNGAGVSVDVDATYGARFYLPAELPDTTATQTGANGQAGFVNVTPPATGLVHVTGTSGGKIVATQDVPVRAGWLTLLWLFPDAKE